MVISPMARVNQRQRNYRLLAQHQNVQRIVILGQRLRNEAVIRWIVHRRIQHPVQLDQAAGFVQLILHAGAKGNLDHRKEFQRQLVAGRNVVPGMSHGMGTRKNQGRKVRNQRPVATRTI
jgi:hypothetical protein